MIERPSAAGRAGSRCLDGETHGHAKIMATILWIIAVVFVLAGLYTLLARRDLLWGIILIVVGLLIGPGGVSIFNP